MVLSFLFPLSSCPDTHEYWATRLKYSPEWLESAQTGPAGLQVWLWVGRSLSKDFNDIVLLDNLRYCEYFYLG